MTKCKMLIKVEKKKLDLRFMSLHYNENLCDAKEKYMRHLIQYLNLDILYIEKKRIAYDKIRR